MSDPHILNFEEWVACQKKSTEVAAEEKRVLVGGVTKTIVRTVLGTNKRFEKEMDDYKDLRTFKVSRQPKRNDPV